MFENKPILKRIVYISAIILISFIAGYLLFVGGIVLE